MAETPDNKDKDLLGFTRDALALNNPAQYLKVEDFNPTPQTTNEEYYPTKDRGVQFATSSSVGRYGGDPLFSGEGSLPPYSLVDARQRAFNHAAMAEQMRKQYQQQSNNVDVNYNRPHDLPLSYNEDYQNVGKNFAMQTYSDAVKYYGGNQRKAAEDMSNPNGVYGKKYSGFNQNYHTYAANVDQMAQQTQDIRKAEQAGTIVVPPEMDKLLQEFERGGFGKLDQHDPDQFKQKFMNMEIMKNMLPAYNDFINKLKPSDALPGDPPIGKYKTRAGYKTTAVNPADAKDLAEKTVNAGNINGYRWLAFRDTKPDATMDEITTKLAQDAVNQHGVQYNPLPEHNGTEGQREYANQKPGEYNVPINIVVDNKPGQETMDYFRSYNTKKPIAVANTKDIYDATTGRLLHDAPTTFDVVPAGTAYHTITYPDGHTKKILAMMGTMKEYSAKDYDAVEKDLWRKAINAKLGNINGNVTPFTDARVKDLKPNDVDVQAEMDRSGKLTHEKTVFVPMEHAKGALEQQGINTSIDEKAVENLPKGTPAKVRNAPQKATDRKSVL